MPNKRRTNARKGKRVSGPRVVTALTQSDTAERALAVRGDRVTVKGKNLATVLITGTIGTALLFPASFGDRVAKLSALFSRWRIVKLIVKNAPVSGTAGFPAAYGLIDDDSTEGGSAPLPTTQAEIVELRCSNTLLSTTMPGELAWKPVDPQKWYYTQAGGASSDPRLYAPASIAVAAITGSTSVSFVYYFTIEMEGAFDNAA